MSVPTSIEADQIRSRIVFVTSLWQAVSCLPEAQAELFGPDRVGQASLRSPPLKVLQKGLLVPLKTKLLIPRGQC